MRRKLTPISTLEKKLDRVFSEYIRKRDADEGGTALCVTCGRLMFWKEGQCGHWIKRQHRSVRWDERNVGFQCPGCNLFKSGAMDEFAGYLLERYGRETVQELLELKHQPKKFTRSDLEQMIQDYKARLGNSSESLQEV